MEWDDSMTISENSGNYHRNWQFAVEKSKFKQDT